MLIAMSCHMQDVSIPFLYACDGYCAHHYVMSYAVCKCSCMQVVDVLTAMSCHAQCVSVLVRMKLLLCSLYYVSRVGCKFSCTWESLRCSLVFRIACSKSVFLYTCNRSCAHWYFVSHTDRKYSCTHAIVVFTGISCRTQPVSVLCSTHAMVVVLTNISWLTQCVSALVRMPMLCSLVFVVACSS